MIRFSCKCGASFPRLDWLIEHYKQKHEGRAHR